MLYLNEKSRLVKVGFPFVLETGLEPVRPNGHWILSPTCLPIPPLERMFCGSKTTLIYFLIQYVKFSRAKDGI